MKASIFYSKAATARILGVAAAAVREVRIWAKVIWVNVKGLGCRFISKRAYHVDFARVRREAAANLQVQESFDREAFLVNGGREPHRVEVDARGGLSCDCWDYSGQVEVMGKGCCKHVYAVLGQMGYGSMAEYIEVNRAA